MPNFFKYHINSSQKSPLLNPNPIVGSTLLYCSPLWQPFLIKDILILERIHRQATNFILNYYSTDYKSRLTELKLLPLIIIKALFSQFQHFYSFNIRSSNIKLCHKLSSNTIYSNSYYHRLPILWNALPSIDLTHTIKQRLKKHIRP